MISSSNKISVKLTRIAIEVTVLLSILMSFGELVIDIQLQKNQSNATAAQIVNGVYPLASKVAYELNAYSADDVIAGLFGFPTVLSAEILGDKNQVLARRKRSVEHSGFSNLINWNFSDIEHLETVLMHENHATPVGQLNVQIDIAQISEQIINRFFTNLALGILRNVTLAIVLLYLFHKFLTRPIVAISKELGNVQPSPRNIEVIKTLANREHDELGELVNSINQLLVSEYETGKKLYHSQKMEAVGQLTGGIAHDFNNILGIVMGNLELIDLKALKDKEQISYVENALYGVNRGAELTRKLLNYSRLDAGEKKLVSVNEIVERMSGLIAKSLAVSVKTTTKLEENIWLIKINPGDLEDALLNLSLNARDAMPDGGDLVIETSNKVLDQDYVTLNPQAEAGEYVLISVTDTGIGMALETREKALEPFFTTKEEGKGTGLGLSMVYSFVRRSGGSMEICSEVGEGTTIRIYLPKAYENGEIENVNQSDNMLPRGDEIILVVDDEKALMSLSTSTLESLGYKTLSSETAEHALKLLEDNQDIDLLFSDIIMPLGMDGYQLALAAHKMRPSLKILLTSGFAKKTENYVNGEREYLTELVSEHLYKPYNLSELARAVRKTLDKDR